METFTYFTVTLFSAHWTHFADRDPFFAHFSIAILRNKAFIKTEPLHLFSRLDGNIRGPCLRQKTVKEKKRAQFNLAECRDSNFIHCSHCFFSAGSVQFLKSILYRSYSFFLHNVGQCRIRQLVSFPVSKGCFWEWNVYLNGICPSCPALSTVLVRNYLPLLGTILRTTSSGRPPYKTNWFRRLYVLLARFRFQYPLSGYGECPRPFRYPHLILLRSNFKNFPRMTFCYYIFASGKNVPFGKMKYVKTTRGFPFQLISYVTKINFVRIRFSQRGEKKENKTKKKLILPDTYKV